MKKELTDSENWLGGLQWLMYIFVNTVVVPITIGAAFGLDQAGIASTMRYAFILGGIACILQALVGHRRAIMDGPSGLWWGVILALASISAAQGIPLAVVGGSLAVGIIITGVLTILVGITGFGYYLEKLFQSSVMGVFMFLFGVALCVNFFKGMLGISYGGQEGSESIVLGVGALSIVISILVLILTVKAPNKIAQYSMLIGIVVGWPLFMLFFGSASPVDTSATSTGMQFFPLGKPSFNIGIIITAVVTGILNLSKQYGSIKGSDIIYTDQKSTSKDYRNSFTITGVFTILSGIFGLVPIAPFVSSIGFIQQTGISKRLPFIFGSVMFLIMGLIPSISNFFTLLPLSIGSAVLFISYIQLFGSSWDWFEKVNFNSKNMYRAAIPLFLGLILMVLPDEAFATLPAYIRPLVSDGLLMGTILALLVENTVKWDAIGLPESLPPKPLPIKQ